MVMKNLCTALAAMVAIFMAGCSSDGNTATTPEVEELSDLTIRLDATIARHGESSDEASFSDGDTMGVYISHHDSENSAVENIAFTYDATDEVWSSESSPQFIDSTTPFDIMAYYPQMRVGEDRCIEFQIESDQSTPSADKTMGGYESSDILWCSYNNVKPSASVELTLKHIMPTVKLTLIKGSGWSDEQWEAAEKSVTMMSVITKTNIDLTTGSVEGISDSEAEDIAMLGEGSAFRAIVAPQEIEPTDILFKVRVGGYIYRQPLTSALNLEAGKSYSYSMPIEYRGENPSQSKLTGKVIGTHYSIDYSTSQKSDKVNTKQMVFDGDPATYFASYDRSKTWVGLDLGEKHIITRIGYAPRPSLATRLLTGIIEGANNEDFSDAMPIHIIKQEVPDMKITYTDVECTRAFRYVRYVSPHDMRCNIAELEFFGIPDEGDDSKLYQLTNLPTVVINTENAADITSKEVEINSTVYVVWDNGREFIADAETGVRGRGNASWGFPKKPYRLKFSKKRSPLGAPAKEKKWTLISNYGDKTLMRNILAFEVSRRVGLAYTPFCQPVDVVLNGEYQGCYQLCDQMEVAENRVDITEMEPTDTQGENLTGGYLIEIDAYAASEPSMFYSSRGTPVTIKSPDDEDIVAEQSKYITDFFNAMEAATFSANYTDEQSGYRKYLDLDSFLKFFIVGEFAGNTDTYWSVYMYKERNSDKLFTGPIWDYDLAFDNDSRTYPISNLRDYICLTTGSLASAAVRDMVVRIVKNDKAAHARLIELWEQAQANGIDAASMNAYIDQTVELLDESQRLNFIRWNILNERVHQNPQALGSYEAEVGTVRKYINQRVDGLDNLIRR